MVRTITSQIEGINGRDYQRLYLRRDLTVDSAFPFDPGDKVRLELVTTAGDREILVVTPARLKVDVDATALELRRSSTEVQVDLEGEVEI